MTRAFENSARWLALVGAALAASAEPLTGPAGSTPAPAPSVAAELGVGSWIWTTNTEDKQTCRLWHAFTIPHGLLLARATLRITADNGYRVFLDGREFGRGGDWKYLTEYDLTWLMTPGRHVLAVEAFNDALEAGVLLGLHVQFASSEKVEVVSDTSWRVVPGDDWGWQNRKLAKASWFPAQIVKPAGLAPWWQHPYRIISAPPLQPPVLHFWQQTWFLAVLLTGCLVVVGICLRQGTQLALQRRSQRLLDRERARIARDIHDDLGAGLTQLTLLGELVLRDMPGNGEPRLQVDTLCHKARALLGSMDEIVWTVNPHRDTVSDFAGFICQHAQEYLASTPIHCRLDVAEVLPALAMDLPARRNLLLAVKEAVRNVARHSGATEMSLRVRVNEQSLEVVVEDDGHGFPLPSVRPGRNGLSNMQQRLADIGGSCQVASEPGGGCRVTFLLPLTNHRTSNGWFRHRLAK